MIPPALFFVHGAASSQSVATTGDCHCALHAVAHRHHGAARYTTPVGTSWFSRSCRNLPGAGGTIVIAAGRQGRSPPPPTDVPHDPGALSSYTSRPRLPNTPHDTCATWSAYAPGVVARSPVISPARASSRCRSGDIRKAKPAHSDLRSAGGRTQATQRGALSSGAGIDSSCARSREPREALTESSRGAFDYISARSMPCFR